MSFNMYGWDTVYAISSSEVNKVLAKNHDKTFQTLDYEDGPISMKGQFGPLSITPGGGGKLLRMEFPITSGTFISPGQPNADLTGVTLIADIELDLLPGDAQKKDLVFNMKKVAADGATGPGIVTPINLLDPNNNLNSAQHSIVSGLLPNYLVSKAPELTFVFANVNFAKPSSDSWLTPVSADYVILSTLGGDVYLAILAVTTSRSISGLKRIVDPGIISSSNNAGLFISSELFMKNVILPVIPRVYSGTSSSDFQYNSSSGTITNVRPFGMPSVKSGAITYHPEVNSLTVSLQGGNLVTSLSGSVDLKAGINMTFSEGVTNRSQFNATNQQLIFLEDNSPSSDHHVSVPWYFVGGAVIALAIANIVASIIASSINNTLNDRAKVTISDSLAPSVQWSGTTPIAFNTAGLDGLLYLQGTLKEGSAT